MADMVLVMKIHTLVKTKTVKWSRHAALLVLNLIAQHSTMADTLLVTKVLTSVLPKTVKLSHTCCPESSEPDKPVALSNCPLQNRILHLG